MDMRNIFPLTLVCLEATVIIPAYCFDAYTFGTGDAVVKGGRYDQLMGYFGKPAASIGFVVQADELLNALSRQKIAVPVEEGTDAGSL